MSKKLCLGAGAALTIALTAAPVAAWEPTKPVEIVVAAGAGGASDQMARMMQAAVQKNNLMKQPMVVSLKGGASGAEALIYMKSSEGDPNKILIAYSLIYMLPLSAKIPFNWRDLTPVSVIALDEFILWVNTQLPYNTVKEFIEAAPICPTNPAVKRQPSSLAITPPRTSTTPRKISKSGAPARCGRCACSTRNVLITRPKSPATCRGTTFRPARRRVSTCNI